MSTLPLETITDGPGSTESHLKHSLVVTSLQLYSVDLPWLERAIEIDHPLKALEGITEVLESCNGLLCLYNSNSEVLLLWNMSTGKHHLLPSFPLMMSPKNFLYVAHGFGYDPAHRDYKVVRIVRFNNNLDTQVMIYRLKSNSWERVGAFPYELPPYRNNGVLADGALHWLITNPDGGISTAAFDLASEDYRVVPQPPIDPDHDFLVQMRAWESRLCVICSCAGKDTDIWVLKHCWSKFLSISDPQVTASPHSIVPLAYVNNGTQLVLIQDNKKLLSYDLETKKVVNVMIRGMPDSFDALSYVESLVNPSPMANGDDATMGNRKSPRSKKNAAKRDDFLSKGFKLVL